MAIKKTAIDYLNNYIKENDLSDFYDNLNYDLTQKPKFQDIITITNIDLTPININFNKNIYLTNESAGDIWEWFKSGSSSDDYKYRRYIRFANGINFYNVAKSYPFLYANGEGFEKCKISQIKNISSYNALTSKFDNKLRFEKILLNQNLNLKFDYYTNYLFNSIRLIDSPSTYANNPLQIWSFLGARNGIGPFTYYISLDKDFNYVINDKDIYDFSKENDAKPINNFDHVMIRVKRLKDVFTPDMIEGLCYNISDEILGDFNDILKKYGDYLVPVASDGMYYPQGNLKRVVLGENEEKNNYVRNMFKNFSLIYPVDSSDTPIIKDKAITNVNAYTSNGINFSVRFSNSLIDIFRCNLTDFAIHVTNRYLSGKIYNGEYTPNFKPFSYDYGPPYLYDGYNLNSLMLSIGDLSTSFKTPLNIEEDNEHMETIADLENNSYNVPDLIVKYDLKILNPQEFYYDYGPGSEPEHYFYNYLYDKKNILYKEEKNDTFDKRCIYFMLKPTREFELTHDNAGPYPYCLPLFNQEDFENYLNAFNIKFKYEFGLSPITPPAFEDGKKIRRESLINQDAIDTVNKKRINSLLNKPIEETVNKIRRKGVNLWQ